MSMLAKNKPTKRIDLGENMWVELRHLSKGVADEYNNSLTNVFSGIGNEDLKGLSAEKQEVPGSMPKDFYKSITDAQYMVLSRAIVSWSEPNTEITFENVKELDGDIFDKIFAEVEKMNSLTKGEIKN